MPTPPTPPAPCRRTRVRLSVALLWLPTVAVAGCRAATVHVAQPTTEPPRASALVVPPATTTPPGIASTDRSRQLSRGGESYVFTRYVAAPTRRDVLAWEGGERERRLASLPADAAPIALANDGTLAYVTTEPDGVSIVDLAAAEPSTAMLPIPSAYAPVTDGWDRSIAPEWNLAWADGGHVLAYSLVFEERSPTERRSLEIGVIEDGVPRVVATDTLRAGPPPTPTPLPTPYEPRVSWADGPATRQALLGVWPAKRRIVLQRVERKGGDEVLSVVAFDMRTGQPTTLVEDNIGPPRGICVKVSPDGRWLAAGCVDGIRLYSLADQDLGTVRRLSLPPERFGDSLSWSPNSGRLAFVLREGQANPIVMEAGLGVLILDPVTMLSRELRPRGEEEAFPGLAFAGTAGAYPDVGLDGWNPDGTALLLAWSGVGHRWVDIDDGSYDLTSMDGEWLGWARLQR